MCEKIVIIFWSCYLQNLLLWRVLGSFESCFGIDKSENSRNVIYELIVQMKKAHCNFKTAYIIWIIGIL